MLSFCQPLQSLDRAVGTVTDEEWLALSQAALPPHTQVLPWARTDGSCTVVTDCRSFVCAVTACNVPWRNTYCTASDALLDYGEAAARAESELLDAVEREVTGIETDLLASNPDKRACLTLIRARRALLALARRCEQARAAIEGLREGGTELASVWGQYEAVQERSRALKDYVTQVREAYQSFVGLKQNALMRTFTVIAAIFMPLQLITGWYGMNLIMPEVSWRGAYPCVIAVCAVLVGVLLAVFHKKHWL